MSSSSRTGVHNEVDRATVVVDVEVNDEVDEAGVVVDVEVNKADVVDRVDVEVEQGLRNIRPWRGRVG